MYCPDGLEEVAGEYTSAVRKGWEAISKLEVKKQKLKWYQFFSKKEIENDIKGTRAILWNLGAVIGIRDLNKVVYAQKKQKRDTKK